MLSADECRLITHPIFQMLPEQPHLLFKLLILATSASTIHINTLYFSCTPLAYCAAFAAQCRGWALLSFQDVCLSVWMSDVCHSMTYSLRRLIDHNQIWYAGTYLSSHACKPFWIPCLPDVVPDGKIWKISPISNFKRLPFGHYSTNQKSRRESMRMSMDSIVPKY